MPWKAPTACEHCGRIKCDCKHVATRRRDLARPHSVARGYGRKWSAARAAFLERYPVCRGCGHPSQVVDHIEPHRGDQKLFWRRSNWQALCKPCHDRKTGSGE